MGYGLPAAIGAAVASGRTVFSLDGDGSIQMNLQELQTIVCNRLPVKILVYNNGGYGSIVRTQRGFFDGRLTGCTKESGLDWPDFSKIASAFGIPYFAIRENGETDAVLSALLEQDGYALCEIFEDPEQGLAFKTTSKRLSDGSIVSAPIDELAPPLPSERRKSCEQVSKGLGHGCGWLYRIASRGNPDSQREQRQGFRSVQFV